MKKILAHETIKFEHITNAQPADIVLRRNGEIVLRVNGSHVIGTWNVRYPAAEGRRNGSGAGLVERIYAGGIPYKGQASGYSVADFKECLCAIIKREGVDVKVSHNKII